MGKWYLPLFSETLSVLIVVYNVFILYLTGLPYFFT